MGRYCYLCGSVISTTTSLHKFPTNRETLTLWLQFCKLNENDDVSKIKICSVHFLSENFIDSTAKSKGGRMVLTEGAFPRIRKRPSCAFDNKNDNSGSIELVTTNPEPLIVESNNNDNECGTPKRRRVETENRMHSLDVSTPRRARRHLVNMLVALHFFAQGNYQKAVGQDFFIAMSQSSVSRCISDINIALEQFYHLIKFPTTNAECEEEKQRNKKYLHKINLTQELKDKIFDELLEYNLNTKDLEVPEEAESRFSPNFKSVTEGDVNVENSDLVYCLRIDPLFCFPREENGKLGKGATSNVSPKLTSVEEIISTLQRAQIDDPEECESNTGSMIVVGLPNVKTENDLFEDIAEDLGEDNPNHNNLRSEADNLEEILLEEISDTEIRDIKTDLNLLSGFDSLNFKDYGDKN
ncbi:hypothetical protein RN001_014647 [Aquatica leii]|uniref:THAP-type domain-containing protein n=1 Tax=Aquatica leii TaxID=1421715 RepID=A0AAN7P0V9_9COLE|nr:hypothetical protein RN001_014647 [Aquatica leii]